jgi:HK97 family phage portal protein
MAFWNRKKIAEETTEVKKKSYTLNNGGGWVNITGEDLKSKDWKTTWVNTGVTVRAENLAKGDVFLYKKAGKNIQEVEEHEFLDLINNPNQWSQSFYELKYLISSSLDIYGEAYLFVAKDLRGKPHSFYLIPANLIKPILNNTKDSIEFYNYNNKKLSLDQIIYFKLPSLGEPFKGVATIESCKSMIDIDNYRQTLQKKFLLTGGHIHTILETEEDLSEETREVLTQLMRDRQNPDNTDAFMVLEGGLKYKDLSSKNKELNFTSTSETIRNEILAKLRVPLVLVGLGDSANRAIAETQSFVFIQNVIRPFSKFIIDKLNIWIKENYGNEFYITMEWETPNDPTSDKDLFDMLFKNEAITIGELREHFGFSSIKPQE